MTCRYLLEHVCTCPQCSLVGALPHPSVCVQCAHYDGPVRGAGDVVHTVAVALGVDKLVGKDCGCAERRRMLNEILPKTLP